MIMRTIIISCFILFICQLGFSQNPGIVYSQTCFGSQTTLSGTSSLPDSDIQLWQWDINNDGVWDYNGKTIVYLFTTSGIHQVGMKITPNVGAPATITDNVMIDFLPSVNFHVDNLCAFSHATYFDQSTIAGGSIVQYLWDFNNDGIVDDNSNDTVTYTCGPAQTYTTKLTCVSDKGCSAFATKTTEVYPMPLASFTVSNTCEGQNTVFTNTTVISTLDFYIWNFGDQEASTVVSPSHTYNSSGNYSVSLIASTVNGCRDTNVTGIFINPAPVVYITSQNNDTVLNNGEQIMLFGNGVGNYLWSGGSTNQNYLVNNAGTYWVTGTDQNGCQGTDNITIYQSNNNNPDSGIRLKSEILTPNGDGINDYFEIENIQQYQCCNIAIYNLWNDKVFWTDVCYGNNWDCRLNGSGNILPDGAYYYIIQCGTETKKGNFNILTNQ